MRAMWGSGMLRMRWLGLRCEFHELQLYAMDSY
jgi:hypothetical protein